MTTYGAILCLAGLSVLTAGGCACSAAERGMDWVHGVSFDENSFANRSSDIAEASLRALPSQATGGGFRIVIEKPGKWRGRADVGSLGVHAGCYYLMAGDVVEVTCSGAPAGGSAEFSLEYVGGPTVKLGAVPAGQPAARRRVEFIVPDDVARRGLGGLWCEVSSSGPGGAEFSVYEFSVYRKRVNTRIDADRILSKPPKHHSRVAMHNGAMAMFVDDKPITGLGWTSILLHTSGDDALKMMNGDTGFKCARLVFMLGSDAYGYGMYPPTWLGPDHFDWSYLDQQMGRIMAANPDTKVMLSVDIDGAKWWTRSHPNGRGVAWKNGVPDYLSEDWKRDSRDAIRQMIAHVQSSRYAEAVIGYELWGGVSLDCLFEINTSTPNAVKRFQDFLRKRYRTVSALRSAWKDPKVTFATAKPKEAVGDPKDPYVLLSAPGRDRPAADTNDFAEWTHSQIVINFCKAVKEATHGHAIAGARTGDLLLGSWEAADLDSHNLEYLKDAQGVDVIEIWEQYGGRGLGLWGSGVPYIPPKALALNKKLVILQNDMRTHTGPDFSCGATSNLAETIISQRRVFANSLVMGMSPYLWQQSYLYAIPELLPEWQRQSDIFDRALRSDRASGAEIAYVVDTAPNKWLGFDLENKAPTRSFAMFEYPRYLWGRAGAPFDMIFLDQLDKAGPYKVYVFFMTPSITEEQMKLIHKVVRQKGRTAIFCWADGLINGKGLIDPRNLCKLTGMTIETQKQPRKWKMSPSDWFATKAGVRADTPMGTLEYDDPCEPNAKENTYSPSFVVNDPGAKPIAYFEGTKDVGIAVKTTATHSTIYCASVNVVPSVMRYAMRLSGAFEYTDTDDICYINRSFVGLHTKRDGSVRISLPSPSALYDVYNNIEHPQAASHVIRVEKLNTYLFFRGTRAKWESLKRN